MGQAGGVFFNLRLVSDPLMQHRYLGGLTPNDGMKSMWRTSIANLA